MFNFLVETLEKLSALVPCKLSHNQNWQRKTIMTIRTGITKVRKAWNSWVPWDQHRGLQHHLHRSLQVGRIPQRATRNSIDRTSVGHSRRLQHGFRQFFATIFFSIIKIPLLDKNKTNNKQKTMLVSHESEARLIPGKQWHSIWKRKVCLKDNHTLWCIPKSPDYLRSTSSNEGRFSIPLSWCFASVVDFVHIMLFQHLNSCRLQTSCQISSYVLYLLILFT